MHFTHAARVGAAVCCFFAVSAAAQTDPPPPLEPTTTTTTTTTTVVPPPPPPPPPQSAAEAVSRSSRDHDSVNDEWAKGARFFVGLRGAVGFPPGGDGLAPLGGLELGVAAKKGVGFGLHVFGTANTPGAPILDLPATDYGFGATADFRYYMQSIPPLRLYPTLSAGFLAGPDKLTGKNAVLPLITPGFGARMNLADVYVAVELGAASFYIPFIALSVGWEPREQLED